MRRIPQCTEQFFIVIPLYIYTGRTHLLACSLQTKWQGRALSHLATVCVFFHQKYDHKPQASCVFRRVSPTTVSATLRPRRPKLTFLLRKRTQDLIIKAANDDDTTVTLDISSYYLPLLLHESCLLKLLPPLPVGASLKMIFFQKSPHLSSPQQSSVAIC